MKTFISGRLFWNRLALATFLFSLSGVLANPIELRNLKLLNSPADEFSPSVTEDGRFLVFNSRRANRRYQDLYYSIYEKGQWSKPEPLTALNSPYNDETPFVSPDGKTIIFASDRDGSLASRDSAGRVRVSFDLYWSHRQGQGWTKPQRVPGNINTVEHERSPTVQRSTGRLFFSRWPFGKFSKGRLLAAQYNKDGFSGLTKITLPVTSDERLHALIPGRGNTFFFYSTEAGWPGWLGCV